MKFYSINEKFIFYNFPITLFTLIPVFLVTGPFLSDFSVSLIALLFLIYCTRHGNYSFFRNKYFFFFLIFWIYLLFNSLLNNFNFDSLKISFFYFRYGVFIVAIASFLQVNSSFTKYFFYSIFFCFVALIVDGFYQYFIGENIFGFKSPDEFRVSSFFGEEMILGSYLSRLWPLYFGLSLIFINKENKFFFLFVLVFILSETLIFLSGDRTAFFYINLSTIFVIVLSKKLLKLRLIILLSSLFLLVIISFFNPAAKHRLIDKTLNQMNLVDSSDSKVKKLYIFSKEHNELYSTAYRIFLDYKIVGVGVKNFRNFCGDKKYSTSTYSCSNHPHNSFLQTLTETGLVGFMFLLFCFFIFFKNVITHLFFKFKGKVYFSDFEICLLSGVLIYLWPLAPTGNIFNNWLTIIISLYFPFLIWSKRSQKN